MHSQMSTPLLLASHTAHWEPTGQYTLISQMRVASLTRPGMVVIVAAIDQARGVVGDR